MHTGIYSLLTQNNAFSPDDFLDVTSLRPYIHFHDRFQICLLVVGFQTKPFFFGININTRITRYIIAFST